MNNDRYYQAALDHVNRVRALRNLDPIEILPVGRTKSFTGCPIARAVGGIVANEQTCVRTDDGEFPHITHEPEVVEFIERFDAGFYPELDGRLAPSRRSDDYHDILHSLATC